MSTLKGEGREGEARLEKGEGVGGRGRKIINIISASLLRI